VTLPTRDGESRGKTALVLAGGGVLGAAYEAGALLALEEQLVGLNANGFDMYVGTSAGAIIASLLANGLPPSDIARVIGGQHRKLRGLDAQDVFTWNTTGLWRWGTRLPGALLRAWASSNRWRPNLPGMLLSLSEALPPGLFDSSGIERFLAEAYARCGGTDRFEQLPRELHVIATNLNTGRRAVFRAGHRSRVRISRAVAASTALPLLYQPVRIGRNAYVDGGLRGNASLDIAVARGARLVICLNAMVPYAMSEDEGDNAGVDGAASTAAQAGDIAWQTLRIVAHASLHHHIENLQQQYPEVNIVCLEPRADEADLLTGHIMAYDHRHQLMQRGYESARASLASRREALAKMFERHGLQVQPAEPGAQRPLGRRSEPMVRLERTLGEIERWVGQAAV